MPGVVYSAGSDGPNQRGGCVVTHSRARPKATCVQGPRDRAYRQRKWPGDGVKARGVNGEVIF